MDLWNEAHHTEILKYIHHSYEEIYGIDLSPDVEKKAKINLEKNKIPVKTYVGDIRKMPFENNTFDNTISIAVIHHLSTNEDIIKAIEELLRVTKKNGYLILSISETIFKKSNFLILNSFCLFI